MNRRGVVLGVLAALPMVALVGCAGQSASQVSARVVADVQLEANGLSNALTLLKAQKNIPPATLAKVAVFISGVQAAAASLQTTTALTSAQSTVIQIESNVNGVVSALTALPLPPTLSAVLEAATVLLPVIESGVNLAVPVGTPKGSMGVGEARLILANG